MRPLTNAAHLSMPVEILLILPLPMVMAIVSE
jgi:hypothetical protein